MTRKPPAHAQELLRAAAPRLTAAQPALRSLRTAAGILARGLVARAWADLMVRAISDDGLTLPVECGSMSPEVEKASPPTAPTGDGD